MDKRHLQNRNVYQGCHYEQKCGGGGGGGGGGSCVGISRGYYECGPRLLHRKIEKVKPKEIPRHLIPRLLVVFTQQLEILLFILTNATNS